MMRLKGIARGIALGMCVLGTTHLNAQTADRPEVLTAAEEMRIALSAAPDHLREGAGYWALEEDGYVLARETQNGFTCIINRDHPLNRKPTCYDAEGTRTILPKVVFVGNLLMRGTPMADVSAEVQEGFASGRFIAPEKPGVAYMLTDEIRNFNPGTGQVGTFPRHLMFYAPNLTNADIGAPQGRDPDAPWLPFIAYQGPHGFMIVLPGS